MPPRKAAASLKRPPAKKAPARKKAPAKAAPLEPVRITVTTADLAAALIDVDDGAGLSVPEAVRAGRRVALEALRDELARTLVAYATEPANKAGIARELRATLKELDELPAPAKADPVDQIAERREARRAAAEASM
jgi:hypothetical protein